MPVSLLVCDLEEGPIKQLQALPCPMWFLTGDVGTEDLPLSSSLHYSSTHVNSTSACPLGTWPACQCHLLKLFLTAGRCVNIPTSPRVGGSTLLTRRKMASSQGLLWILGTERQTHQLWTSASVVGHFTKQSEGQVLSKGCSRLRL